MVLTILRVKRKAEEPAESNLVVKGLLNYRAKRIDLSGAFSGLDVGISESTPQYFAHTKTIDAVQRTSVTSVHYGEARQCASLLRSSQADQRVPSSTKDDHRQTDAFQAGVYCRTGPELMEDVRLYDVLRNATETTNAGSTTPLWTATRVGSRESRNGEGSDPDIEEGSIGEFVYDLYALRQEQGTSAMSQWDNVPEVQMLYDSSDFWEDSQDETYNDDSEDSNAERHYTHEYPDEVDSQSNDEASSEYGSESDW